MGIFNKSETLETQLADTKQKLTAAETHITELEEENKTFAENIKTANDAAAQAKADADTAAKSAEVANAAHESAVAAHAEFKKTVAGFLGIDPSADVTQELIEKTINDKAQAKAIDIAASQGTQPVPTARTTNSAADEKQMSRTDFQNLNPREKSAFCLGGGKLTD